MTPEEQATAVVLVWYQGPYNLHADDAAAQTEIADIAAAIAAAIEAEREACAKVCEQVWEDYGYLEAEHTVKPLIKECAATIRARKGDTL